VSLGLPSHLAQQASSSSFVRALHTVGLTSLAAAFLTTVVFQAEYPADPLWPAMIALVPMAVLLWLHLRTQSLFFAVSFLSVGSVCAYWYLVTYYSQVHAIMSDDTFTAALPKIALLMVGGSGVGLLTRFAWLVVGYISAEIVSAAALLTSGHPLEFDSTTFSLFAIVSLILLASFLSRQRIHRTQPLLHRAARDEQVATMRSRIETKAAALMHDTVLSQLAAIANSTGDALDPRLRADIERDLRSLIGEEWLTDEASVDLSGSVDLRLTGLAGAIREAEAMGLVVQLSGEAGAVNRLSSEASKALGLAVKQCLVNVLKHSGTDQAEVVAYATDDEVSVMVIDAGRGFFEAEAGTDRLGLRSSVRRRMESVGGSVRVWSTPGRGTSIMIRVPARSAEFPLEVDA